MIRVVIVIAFVISAFHFDSSIVTDTKSKVQPRNDRIEMIISQPDR